MSSFLYIQQLDIIKANFKTLITMYVWYVKKKYPNKIVDNNQENKYVTGIFSLLSTVYEIQEKNDLTFYKVRQTYIFINNFSIYAAQII